MGTIKLLIKEFCMLYSKTKANDKRKRIKYVETQLKRNRILSSYNNKYDIQEKT
jgi:hypothetical protein